jgi:hypothetical protein
MHCSGIVGNHGPQQFCDLAVHCGEGLAHGNVVQVVEFREDRHFREFGHTCHKNKPKLFGRSFDVDVDVEVLQYLQDLFNIVANNRYSTKGLGGNYNIYHLPAFL